MPALEELLELEKKLRYREDSPTGVAAGIRVPERPPTPGVMLDEEESDEDK
jgi:hypothetical protein